MINLDNFDYLNGKETIPKQSQSAKDDSSRTWCSVHIPRHLLQTYLFKWAFRVYERGC